MVTNDLTDCFSARKTSVLGSNADASTRFGADLQGLSKELRHGLQKMHTAQNEMGRQLKVELSAHATKGQEVSLVCKDAAMRVLMIVDLST